MEQPPLIEDLHLSHNILSFLFGGYQGSYAAMNILGKLGHKKFNQDLLLQYDKTLTKIYKLTEDLYAGNILVSTQWQDLETFEATSSFDDIEKLRKELTITAGEIVATHNSVKAKNGSVNQEDVKILLASYARFLYSRDYYLKSQLQYAQVIQSQELMDNTIVMASTSQNELEAFDPLIEQAQNGLPSKHIQTLLKATDELPVTFSIQIHECYMYLGIFKNPFTYKDAGFEQKEAEMWEKSKIIPQEAGFWRSHLFDPVSSKLWIDAGVENPAMAFAWDKNGFDYKNFIDWINIGLPPEYAADWRKNGFTAKEAQSFIENNITDPKEAKKNTFKAQKSPN